VEDLESDSDSDSPVPPVEKHAASLLAWLLLLLVVLGIPCAMFVWLGGVRLVKRWLGIDDRKGKGKPNTRRDGYMRVDLEK